VDPEAERGVPVLARSMTTRSASGNIAGSRLAAGKDSSTISPQLKVVPSICVSLTISRAIVTGE
jgi:hypothetical protein